MYENHVVDAVAFDADIRQSIRNLLETIGDILDLAVSNPDVNDDAQRCTGDKGGFDTGPAPVSSSNSNFATTLRLER